MATTFKRQPHDLSNHVDNYSKYLNQIGFKGIIHENNLFEVDPLSLKNAKNVYLDDNKVLISRNPIVSETLPITYGYILEELVEIPIIPVGYNLVDMFETGKIIVYVCQQVTTGLFRIVAKQENSNLIMILPHSIRKYYISAIEHYIIVFNNIDAMVLETDNFENDWKPLRDFAEIPVTKRVVGQDVFQYPVNQFTESFKEEYLWSDEVSLMLPEGTAEVTVNQSPKNLIWTLDKANINTETRVLRSLGVTIQPSDIVSVATNTNTGITVICVARSNYVLISLNEGLSFESVLYPFNTGFLQVASVSDDGLFFFFVAQDGVHRYDINNKSWTIIRLAYIDNTPQHLDPPQPSLSSPRTLDGMGINNICHFLSGEAFSFILKESGTVTSLYAKGPGLKMGVDEAPVDYDFGLDSLGMWQLTDTIDLENLDKTWLDCVQYSIFVIVENDKTSVGIWLPSIIPGTTSFTSILGQGDSLALICTQSINRAYGIIESMKVSTTIQGVEIEGLSVYNNSWYSISAIIGKEGISDKVEFIPLNPTNIPITTDGAPINLKNSYLVNLYVYSIDGVVSLPNELSKTRQFTIGHGRYFYMCINNILYTNKMLSTNNATITYTRISTTPYIQVPNISHVNNELYLTFGDTIKITANDRDGTKLKFNLPVINNHAFTSDITGMINISALEVAIFLIDQIYLVTQVADDLLGYRYDYYNTRLSSGVRLGDTIINTQNGVYTLYPTSQGLAAMNYQPDVATTEQMIDYVTKNILDIWTKFYNEATNIKMVQTRDYVFLSNGTISYLMLDLRDMTWWVFESPIPVTKMIMNQSELRIISNGLYKFNKDYKVYKDFYVKLIDWQIESQVLHFGLPSHYKNMKQIIYQFEESSDISQTINSQIKLYRKRISYKEPEIIEFNVEGYRTFIQRFNYWKINELQWALAADLETQTPAQLRLNGLTIKYEQGEEIRS